MRETKEQTTSETKPKTQLPSRNQSSAKRKLVTKDSEGTTTSNGKDVGKDGGGKKKKKGDKKLLSFGDDE